MDITSNPASLDFNPNAGAFASLAALPGGSVTAPSVVLTSQQGDPIPNWPVTFSVASGGGTINNGTVPVIVVTGPGGVASLTSWNLGAAGINTVSATPTPVTGQPTSSTIAYQPAGAFDPGSRIFTATAAGAIGYEATGWRYLLSDSQGAFPVSVINFDEPSYKDTGWSTGHAGFGVDNDACTLNQTATSTEWPEFTQILLRKPFTVPLGVSSVEINVAIDNNIKVFVNGTDVTGTADVTLEDGFVAHEGCATRGSFSFSAEVTSGINWLAIHGVDEGSSAYVDAEVVPITE